MSIVVGLQWGDEGKGKMIDILSSKAQHVVRAQGGNNAGHTIIANGIEFKMHLIPSGIIYPHTRCYLSAGVALDPKVLIQEIEDLESKGIVVQGRLCLSPLAHLIMPYHRLLDLLSEKSKGALAIGTTGKGIGPCYIDRVGRRGIRIAELLDETQFRQRLKEVLPEKNREITLLYGHEPLDEEAIIQEYLTFAAILRPYVGDAEKEVAHALKSGAATLFEGAHGSFLDATFGTYPYVTSSGTIASGVAYGAGIGPSQIKSVFGIVKAYTTRVGNGPLPTALAEEDAKLFPDNYTAREIGTTTGRLRRLGWFDAVLVRRGVELSGVTDVAIMKLDILDKLDELKICVAYEIEGKRIENFPASTYDLAKATPIYETLPGWLSSTTDMKEFEKLPENAKRYLMRIEELIEAPIRYVSVGPEREKTMERL